MNAIATKLPQMTPEVIGELSRCDHCRAPGKVRVELLSGLDLVFCGHHAREHGPDLLDRALCFELIDPEPAPVPVYTVVQPPPDGPLEY